jgi:hypothetical protein
MKIRIHSGLDHITDRADLLRDFVVFVCKDLQCTPCPIDIVNGRKRSGLKTTAQYDPNNHHVMVNAKNRHFGDVLRSIAHELVHHKQNLNGELDTPVQDVGGDIEDEANARAGELLKSFAYQKGPERIYENAILEQKKVPGYFRTRKEKELEKIKTFGTPGFAEEFYKQAYRIGAKPTDLATIISKESAYTWSPKVRPYSPKQKKYLSSARGLIQFISRTQRALEKRQGVPFPKDDPVAQMKFVGDYFDMVKEEHPDADYSNIVDLYLAVFHPYALGKKPGYVIGSEKPNNYATVAAEANPAYIDRDMTLADLERLPGRELGNVARRERELPEIGKNDRGELVKLITKKSIAKKVKRWKKTPMADSLDPKDFGAGDLPAGEDVQVAEARQRTLIKNYITEMITAYGVGRVDPTQGGVGRMFKLGVDYKNAGTNIPHTGQGYVDRTRALPYEITVRTNQDARQTFNTFFSDDLEADYVTVVTDQVHYGNDGFRLSAHVATGANRGDERDAKLIQDQLYKYIMALPSTPKDASFIIDVSPVDDKIRH